jgi:hypothetical protein
VRELFVGTSTLQLFLGSVVAPGFLERMMAASAYDAQQSDEAEPGHRPDNLFEPAPGHHSAHGRFDDRARGRGLVVSSTTLRRGTVAGGALLTLLVGVGLGALLRGQRR